MTKLPFVVECRSTYPFFEPIAAFNVEVAAMGYALDCAEANPNFKYQVTKTKKVLATNEYGKWVA